jgi:hypothetical protein
VTELDLGLKVGSRRLLWSMGFSTRLDVELRGFSRGPTEDGSLRAPESFTDLDVLGVAVAPGFRLTSAIADCKTTRRDSTSRMFWVRGVADLFGADQAFLVREHDVTDAARQLSSRLGITVLTSEDLTRMQEFHGDHAADPSGPLSVLFDRTAVAAHLAAFTGLDRRLKRLLEYRQFDYWVYDEHRNPIQLVAHLNGARKHLSPKDPSHLALFLDLAWMYLLTLIHLTEHVRTAYLGDPDRGLQEYLFGGATALREKEQVAKLLRTVAPSDAEDLNHLPPYYSSLRELTVRLLRRPAQIQDGLRYAEAATALAAGRYRIPLGKAFGSAYDPIPAKLVADICGFLVAAGDLHPDFRSQARAFLLGEPLHAPPPPTRRSTATPPAKQPIAGPAVPEVTERPAETSAAQLPLPESEPDAEAAR